MMKKQTEMVEAAARALKAKDGTKEPGMCWRFCRLGIVEALGLSTPGAGKDAKGAAAWYQARGFAVDCDGWKNSLPGDLVFWLHGKHGHVALRVLGNQIAENSTVHSTKGSDARGTRALKECQPPDVVIRLWKAAKSA